MFRYKGQPRFWDPRYLGLINHVIFVLDASSSMRYLRGSLLALLKRQIELLAEESEKAGQETRISVYLFADRVECVAYDRDVLRPIDFSDIYRAEGMTALVDATALAVEELGKTGALHGDHAYWINVITDGGENASSALLPTSRFYAQSERQEVLADALRNRLTALPAGWTTVCFVPDESCARAAVSYGFPQANVQKWDATSVEGVKAMDATLTRATSTYFTGRSAGTSSFQTGGLFGAAVTEAAVAAAGLTPVDPKEYALIPVVAREQAQPWCISNGFKYESGCVYYEWFKTETIRPDRNVLLLRRRDNVLLRGKMGDPEVRRLLGLPDGIAVKGKPAKNAEFMFFVPSRAINRAMIPTKHGIVYPAVKMATAKQLSSVVS
jgi:hypothetical protein